MDYDQAGQDLLLGILEALPNPTALLNRLGQTVYVNGVSCPIDLNGADFSRMPEVLAALDGAGKPPFRTELATPEGSVTGLMEVYPVKAEDSVAGALVLFRPDPSRVRLTGDALPTVSAAMNAVWERLERLSMLKTPVLLLGEPGLCKSDFIGAIHRLSSLRDAPLVTIRRDSGPGELLDAASEAGTVFCERIDLWEGKLLQDAVSLAATRFAGKKPVAARLTATAAPDLADKAKRGEFPEELFTRINIMPVFLPPLRDRPEDIPPAARRLAQSFAAERRKDIAGFSDQAMEILRHQAWAGNLRELRDAVSDAVDACPGGVIQAANLSGLLSPREGGNLRSIRNAYGRDHAKALVSAYGQSLAGKRKAANEMGISLSTLYRILGSH
ncbi:MAG: sigma 54-interacting transcriptional regulator [Oscillospiraceae bacterium]|jgi:DNA-binding NtrC family response regulator|nr:sigma 54-interacting transcriptional regulator [Oscillospiraceae bacterium]